MSGAGRRLRVGVVGVGHLGRHHARLYAALSGANARASELRARLEGSRGDLGRISADLASVQGDLARARAAHEAAQAAMRGRESESRERRGRPGESRPALAGGKNGCRTDESDRENSNGDPETVHGVSPFMKDGYGPADKQRRWESAPGVDCSARSI